MLFLKNWVLLIAVIGFTGNAAAFTPVDTKLASLFTSSNILTTNQIVLRNDSFEDQGGQAYLQTGFVANEMAGVWIQVPTHFKRFKVDFFRVLVGSDKSEAASAGLPVQYRLDVASAPTREMGVSVENTATVTPGLYWNDIPIKDDAGFNSLCALGGQYVGAALKFTHTGTPSVYRDADGINPGLNVLYAIPGGWNYSANYGVKGDWVLRVVGHEADPSECD